MPYTGQIVTTEPANAVSLQFYCH